MIEMATFLHLPGPHVRLNAVTEAGFPIPCLRLTTAAAAADVPVLAVSNGTVVMEIRRAGRAGARGSFTCACFEGNHNGALERQTDAHSSLESGHRFAQHLF